MSVMARNGRVLIPFFEPSHEINAGTRSARAIEAAQLEELHTIGFEHPADSLAHRIRKGQFAFGGGG